MVLATWRIVAAGVLGVLAYLLSKPVMEALLAAIRRRIGKGFLWIADVQRYMLLYLSWICFALLLLTIARYILELHNDHAFVDTLQYLLAIPVVLGTFSMRKVVTNVTVRHFKWDHDRTENDTRIFVITECINFFVFAMMTVEVFYIFFVSNEMAQFLLVLVFACLETLVILAGFTTLKNVATGLFLIFAEPFRTGVECHVRELRGLIERVSLARTTLRRRDGALVYIPNGVFADSHQTTGSADTAQLHALELRVHRSTPIDRIQQLIDELTVILPQFAAIDDAATAMLAAGASCGGGNGNGSRAVSFRNSESVATPQSMTFPPMDNRSFASTDVRSDERSSVRVVLCAMYRVKVSVVVDRARFASLEAIKTEINMVIVESLQRVGVSAVQQRIVRR